MSDQEHHDLRVAQLLKIADDQSTRSAFSGSQNPDEDWTKIEDLAERRRIQIRIAQRNYRKKLERRIEDLERRSKGSDEHSDNPTNAPNYDHESNQERGGEFEGGRKSSPDIYDHAQTFPNPSQSLYFPTQYKNGSMLPIGDFRNALFHCRYQGLQPCPHLFHDIESLQVHFEDAHFAFTRIDPAARFVCSECGHIDNHIDDPRCRQCRAGSDFKMWIYGHYIQHSSYGHQPTNDQDLHNYTPTSASQYAASYSLPNIDPHTRNAQNKLATGNLRNSGTWPILSVPESDFSTPSASSLYTSHDVIEQLSRSVIDTDTPNRSENEKRKATETLLKVEPPFTANKHKNRRASRPKVKTGCNNCKNRRVRCDETRPQCIKCVRSGRLCEGYPTHKMTVGVAVPIAPQPEAQSIASSSTPPPFTSASFLTSPPASRATVRSKPSTLHTVATGLSETTEPEAKSQMESWMQMPTIYSAQFARRVGHFLEVTGLLWPSLAHGKTRIEWQCRCGHNMYDDFIETKLGAAEQFRLAVDHSSSPVQSTGTWKDTRLGQAFSGIVESFGAMINRNTRQGSEATLPIHSLSSNSGVAASTTNSDISRANAADLMYLLLCYKQGRYATRLLQLDLITQKAASDKALFKVLRKNYTEMRGRWHSFVSFSVLCSIKFVQFDLYKSELVDIRKEDDIPPPGNIEYRYRPAPPDLIPPVGERHLMHLFEHPDHAEDEPICLDRFPKKLKEKLKCNGGTSPGWGLQFVEGWDWRKIWAIVFVIFGIGSLLIGILLVVFDHNIQDAFTMASYVVAMAAVTVGTLQAFLAS